MATVGLDRRFGGAAARERRTEAGLATGGLVLLYAFTLVAVVGYAVFGRDPARLVGQSELVLTFYARSFGFFALGQVWLALGVLAAVLTARAGTRWLVAFGGVYAVSLASELAGTTWGVPFGAYAYSGVLAPLWFERVPVMIPVSWFCMAVASYALASVALRGRVARVVAGSLVLLTWDLALDPAMSYATRYWTWADSGPYYGMPWLNLFGWYVTGLALMSILAGVQAEAWTARLPARWWVAYYGANLLMPLGMCVAAGLWPAVLLTTSLLGLTGLVLWRRVRVVEVAA